MSGDRLPDRPLLTIPETAREYSIGSESTLYARARAGELPGAITLGGRWYVKRAVLERWLRGEDSAA